MSQRILSLILCGSIACFGFDCDDEDLPPSINGNYIGTYSFVEIHGAADTIQNLEQEVQCKFRKPDFSMERDPIVPESLRVFCDVLGTYVLGKGVKMNVTDWNRTDAACTASLGPEGLFSLDQTTDTMWLTRDTTMADTIRYVKKLALLRAVL